MARKAKATIHFVSLGCVKNRVDSEVMLGVAQEAGLTIVDDPDTAETIVVNTCGFIGEAKKESIQTILELSEWKRVGACKKLVVAGCLSQSHAPEMAEGMPEVDHFLGSSDMLRLREVLTGNAPRMAVGTPSDWVVRASDPRVVTQSRASVFVKMAEGCNRTCSFCIIPKLRGAQRSRPLTDIVEEVTRLVDAGAREINLISQDSVALGRDLPRGDRHTLADAVHAVAEVPGVHWVRLFYLYPENLDARLLTLLASHPKVVPYVDMPLQHAADAMLKRMRRGHGSDRSRRVVETLRAEIPNLVMRTAFIVGHPGETDEEFEELVRFVEWARFDHVGVFRYSDEEDCQSHSLQDKVGPLVVANRYRKLMALQRRIARASNRRRIGQTLEVLVDGVSEEHELVMKGRYYGQAPEIDGQVYLSGGEVSAGDLVKVEITGAADYDLVGEVLEDTRVPFRKKARVALPVIGSSGHSEWQ